MTEIASFFRKAMAALRFMRFCRISGFSVPSIYCPILLTPGRHSLVTLTLTYRALMPAPDHWVMVLASALAWRSLPS